MAVYTDVLVEELAEFLQPTISAICSSYKGIAEGVENSNFLLHTDAGYFILTLYEKRVAAGDLPFFLGLMEHLAAAASAVRCRSRPGRRGARNARRPAGGDRHLSRRHVAAPPTPRIAAPSARRWRACTWPGATFR